jgi:hypothetical protein
MTTNARTDSWQTLNQNILVWQSMFDTHLSHLMMPQWFHDMLQPDQQAQTRSMKRSNKTQCTPMTLERFVSHVPSKRLES